MKKSYVLLVVLLIAIAGGSACKKSGGGDCNEPRLQFATTPALNSVEPAAPGPNFPLQVNITDNLPTGGVTIIVTARPDASQTTFFSETRNSNSASNAFTITNTPSDVLSVVEITVTSRSCNTNTATGTYRYSRK